MNGSSGRLPAARSSFRYLTFSLAALIVLGGDLSGLLADLRAADNCIPCIEEQNRLLQSVTTDCVQTPDGPPMLTAEDVRRIVRDAARAVSDTRMVIAVTDRAGRILAVFRKPNAPTTVVAEFGLNANGTPNGIVANANDVAVALARTGAFFSNDQAPLSSRTVRFISGIHFPPGIAFTPNAALYGIENTNRGCDFGGPDQRIFNTGKVVPRARSLEGEMKNLPCNSANRSGCGRGIATGKATLSDDFPYPQALDPGGIPIFKKPVDDPGVRGRVAGGVGVVIGNDGQVRTRSDLANAERAAVIAACPGLGSILPLPPPGVIFLDGIRLPFAEINGLMLPPVPSDFQCPSQDTRPFPQPGEGTWAFGPVPGGVVCDGWLSGPKGSDPGINHRLTQAEVERIVRQAALGACRTRAAIRLPQNEAAKMVIAVSDVQGNILGLFRMPDSTIFSIDVAVTKARNVVYFSSAELKPQDLPEVPVGTAVTNRTISFGSQPLFPPGIGPGHGPFDPASAGPFFELYKFDTMNPCTQGRQPKNPNQSGIVFFPGSAPLYRDGILVGGLGISGDGVEQDDVVTAAGAQGFEPPPQIRADQIMINTPQGPVRLPYLKFNRDPERQCEDSSHAR